MAKTHGDCSMGYTRQGRLLASLGDVALNVGLPGKELHHTRVGVLAA